MPRNPRHLRSESGNSGLDTGTSFAQRLRLLLSRTIFGALAIVAAFQLQEVNIKFQIPFLQQVWIRPASLLRPHAELSCCANYAGAAGWDNLLRAADQTIPRSESILFLSPVGTVDASMAHTLAIYALFPRQFKDRMSQEFDLSALSEMKRVGVRYALLYRVKPESLAILKDSQLKYLNFGDGIFLLNLSSGGEH